MRVSCSFAVAAAVLPTDGKLHAYYGMVGERLLVKLLGSIRVNASCNP